MLTKSQVLELKEHSLEAVASLPDDHKWIHYLGSLDLLCDTTLKLFEIVTKEDVAGRCSCGGKWRTDGVHQNVFCSLCFKTRTDELNLGYRGNLIITE